MSKVVKPTPPELMEDTGTGLDYGTRPDRMPGYLVPNDRFYIRSHAPTPHVEVADWALAIEGDGVRQPVTYSYDELWNRFPLVSVVRTIECAGNRRVLLGNEFASTFEGTQWGRGAIGTAEWTGVRLRDLLEPADLAPGAREVMPESLDEIRARRPMPLAKARADDTLVALAMNGEILPADHGFPARVVVSGWLGAASIKWLARIEVSQGRLYAPWNTEDYVLIGPGHPPDGPARPGHHHPAGVRADGAAVAGVAAAGTADDPRARVRRGERDRRRRVPHRRRSLAGLPNCAPPIYRAHGCAGSSRGHRNPATTSSGYAPPTSAAAPNRTRRSGTSSDTSRPPCSRTPCTSSPLPRPAAAHRRLAGDRAAEEGLDEGGAGGKFGRGSLHPHLAPREDVGSVGDREHGASALLDDQHRGPARG